MPETTATRAEIEYAVMLVVLDFHTEFMKTNYSNVQVHVFDELIEVALTKTTSIPAETLLIKSAGGGALLRQYYRAMFDSCQGLLCKRIERAIGAKVHNLVADLDPSAGRTTLLIRLQEPLTTSTVSRSNT